MLTRSSDSPILIHGGLWLWQDFANVLVPETTAHLQRSELIWQQKGHPHHTRHNVMADQLCHITVWKGNQSHSIFLFLVGVPRWDLNDWNWWLLCPYVYTQEMWPLHLIHLYEQPSKSRGHKHYRHFFVQVPSRDAWLASLDGTLSLPVFLPHHLVCFSDLWSD